MTATARTTDLRAPLRSLFGFDDFLPGQQVVAERALAGRDTLAVMPTGAGKSLPYQLAAALRPSPTLVLSPLISLMKDQLDKLPAPVAARAAFVNSSLAPGDVRARLGALAAGDLRLLYAAPERLRQASFVRALARAGVGLVVVDEVHCVSMWGHDFRPDYLYIRKALADLGEPPVLGLTATATPAVEDEIARALGRDFDVVRASVVRPNLRHAVERVDDEEDRRRAVLSQVRAAGGPAIVYARSRKKCEGVAALLRSHGVRAVHYHAGLAPAERTEAQDAFLSDRARVVVATTAFGMGIDKPDIRLVLLYNMPGSLEDYVQMAGRAGRDGEPSRCIVLAGERDARELARFAEADVPSRDQLGGVYRALRARADGAGVADAEPDELVREDGDARVLVGMLEQAGLLRRTYDVGRAMRVELGADDASSAGRIAALVDRSRAEARARVRDIVDYARSDGCRQRTIAQHFGERLDAVCGSCDRCTATGVEAFADVPAELPVDIAGSIIASVSRLRWPLGRSGLAALLAGSVAAPPSARRSPDFGVLAAAAPATIRRWVDLLVASGHLEPYESDDGYRLLRVARADDPPRLVDPRAIRARDADEPLDAGATAAFERLRTWRLSTARASGMPAYAVLPDRTLRAIATTLPADDGALAALPGIGPAKIARYGAELLRLTAHERG